MLLILLIKGVFWKREEFVRSYIKHCRLDFYWYHPGVSYTEVGQDNRPSMKEPKQGLERTIRENTTQIPLPGFTVIVKIPYRSLFYGWRKGSVLTLKHKNSI